MVAAYVSGATNTATGTSVTVTYTSAANNCLVACVQHVGGAVTGVTDSASNTWIPVTDSGASNAAAQANEAAISIWICVKASAVSSVTVSQTSSAIITASVLECSGVDPINPLASYGQNYSATSTTMGVASGSFTGVATLTSLAIVCGGYLETTAGTRLETVPASFTAGPQTNSGTTTLATAYRAFAVSSTVTFSSSQFTLGTTKRWGAVIIVLKSPQTVAQNTASAGYEAIPPDGAPSETWVPVPVPTPVPWVPAGTPSDTPIEAFAPSTKGQLWPRGNTRN